MTTPLAELPTMADVRAAAARIAPHLRPTALHPAPALSARVGTPVWVKHENHQPVGAFKVRGGVNLASELPPDTPGLICASTGNHGLSVAYAARRFGLAATVCVPASPNPAKVGAIRALGAEVVEHGADFDAARVDVQCVRLRRRSCRAQRPS